MVIYSLSDIKKILDALSNENRIRILRMLEKKCMCVCEIGYILKIKQPAVTKHMHKLKRSGLVNERKNGQFTEYRLNNKNPFIDIWYVVRDFIKKDEIVKKDLIAIGKLNAEKRRRISRIY